MGNQALAGRSTFQLSVMPQGSLVSCSRRGSNVAAFCSKVTDDTRAADVAEGWRKGLVGTS